jgi:hypothetical protein
MRKTGLVLFFAGAILILVCVTVQAITLPDTGQTKCYDSEGTEIPDCTSTGQDGEYHYNPMSYTDHGDGTVTDNNTGLMWQKCSMWQNHLTCSGGAPYANWYQASGTYHAIYNSSSMNVCGSLQLGEYTDWRLPTRKDLLTIVNHGTNNPAIETTVFPNTPCNQDYNGAWSSEYPNEYDAWFVDFQYGEVKINDMNLGPRYIQVRCVRGPQANPFYIDHGNGTVTDNRTGLIWQKCSAGQNYLTCSGEANTMNWEDALTYCNNLYLGVKTDWRLPNIRELISPTDLAYFPNTGNNYWSSTSFEAGPSMAWGAAFGGQGAGYEGKGIALNARCVRGDGHAGSFLVSATAVSDWEGSKCNISSNPTGINVAYPTTKNSGIILLKGSSVVVTATAPAGAIVSWTDCATAGGTESGKNTQTATCSFTNLGEDKAVTASFVRTTPGNGECGSANGRSFTTTPTSNLCAPGSTAGAVTAIGTGWTWTCTGQEGGQTASCAANLKTYTITTASLPSDGGTVTCVPNPVYHGSTSVCTITPASDYVIASAAGCGTGILNNNTYNTGVIKSACTVTGYFAHELTVTISGQGEGSVTDSAGTLVFTGNTGTGIYDHGQAVTLTATVNESTDTARAVRVTAAGGSYFLRWDGCDSASGVTCNLSMNSNRTAKAVFSCDNKAVIVEGTGQQFDSIQAAYDGSSTGSTIETRNLAFSQNLAFASGKTISLLGGYNCGYTAQSGFTTVKGSLTIGGTDRVTIDKIRIK